MAEQVAANLSCLTTTFYNTAHQAQIHTFYKRAAILTYGKDLLTSWMDMNSTVKTRPAKSFNHLEYDRLTLPITVAGGSGAAGANVTLTVTGGYNALGIADVQPGYKVSDGVNIYVITAMTNTANANTITIAPPNGNVAISIASGASLEVIPSVSVAEGSTTTNNSIRSDGVIFNNTMGSERRDLCITDDNVASFSQEVTFWDQPNPLTGESETFWYNAEIGRMETEFRNALEVLGITGQQYTNTTLTALGYGGTTGVIPSIQAAGNLLPYQMAQGFQISDFDDMSIVMEKNKSAAEYLWYDGIVLNTQVMATLKDYFPNGAVTYGAFNGNKDAALQWGFASYATNRGRTFHFHNMEIFNAPNWLGNTSLANGGYIQNAIVLPATQMKNAANEMVSNFEKVHLAGNGFDNGYDHYVVDGLGKFMPMPAAGWRVTPTRTCIFTWFTTFGIEAFAMKQCFYVSGV